MREDELCYNAHMAKKSTNQLIEELALSVKKGFDEVHEKVDTGLEGVQKELKEVNSRLTKIENGHVGRIERLEDDMARVKVKVGIR